MHTTSRTRHYALSGKYTASQDFSMTDKQIDEHARIERVNRCTDGHFISDKNKYIQYRLYSSYYFIQKYS